MFIKTINLKTVKYIMSHDESINFESKIKAFDAIIAAIEKPNNHVKVKIGWAFDVDKIIKDYKRGVKDYE